MNRVILLGRLSRDPEVRVTQDGQTTIAKFGIAVDRRGKEDKADFFNVTAFNKTAIFVEKYLKKGTKVAITGQLRTDSYTNKNGQKVTSVFILADRVEFCERKAEEKQNDGFLDIPKDIQEELPFNF